MGRHLRTRFPQNKGGLAELLIERVDIGTFGLHVRLRVDGLTELTRVMLDGGIGSAA